MNIEPGMVSDVLWHFPGGPECRKADGENADPSDNDIFAIFTSILQSHQLWANCAEQIQITLPHVTTPTGKQLEDVTCSVATSAVGCLAEIPRRYLHYHGQRYGCFGIGFRRDAALKHGFHPVLYTPQSPTNAEVITSLWNAHSRLAATHYSAMVELARSLPDSEVINSPNFQLTALCESVDPLITSLLSSVQRLASFVKTFTEDEFSTVYCEREWRSLDQFNFTDEDVVELVLPKAFIANDEHFPASVKVTAWEELPSESSMSGSA